MRHKISLCQTACVSLFACLSLFHCPPFHAVIRFTNPFLCTVLFFFFFWKGGGSFLCVHHPPPPLFCFHYLCVIVSAFVHICAFLLLSVSLSLFSSLFFPFCFFLSVFLSVSVLPQFHVTEPLLLRVCHNNMSSL